MTEQPSPAAPSIESAESLAEKVSRVEHSLLPGDGAVLIEQDRAAVRADERARVISEMRTAVMYRVNLLEGHLTGVNDRYTSARYDEVLCMLDTVDEMLGPEEALATERAVQPGNADASEQGES